MSPRASRFALAAAALALSTPLALRADPLACNPATASVTLAPSDSDWGMLLFEDLWPASADYDFNDEVVAWQAAVAQDANGNTLALQLNLSLLAEGATLHNGLYLHLPLPSNAARTILLTDASGQHALQPMAKERELVLELAPDTRALLGNAQGFINTEAALPAQPAGSLSLQIAFAAPVQLDPAAAPYDTFLARTGAIGHQLHLPQFAGTDQMDTTLFDHGDDASVDGGAHFINGNNLPFVFQVPQLVAWPLETIQLSALYLDLGDFISSGGQSSTSWYLTDLDAPQAWSGAPAPQPAQLEPGFAAAQLSCGSGAAPDPSLTYAITASPDWGTADGQTAVAITAAISSGGAPLAGQTVTFDVSGDGNSLAQPTGITGADGTFTTTLTSTVAEVKTISVEVDTGAPLQLPFVPAGDQPDPNFTQLFNDGPTDVLADGTQPVWMGASVNDASGNPLVDYPVLFLVDGSGNSPASGAALTDQNGQVSFFFTSTVPETKNVTLIAGPVTLTTQVNLVWPNQTANFFGDGPWVIASGTPDIHITLQVTDNFSQGLMNVPVSFSITTPGFSGVWSPADATALTDPMGNASVLLGETLVGSIDVAAIVGPGTPYQFEADTFFFVQPAGMDASRSSFTASPAEVNADGQSGIVLSGVVHDAYGNPAGQVAFSTGGPEDLIYPAFSLLPDPLTGLVSGTLYSTQPGSRTVTLSSPGYSTSLSQQVTFDAPPASSSQLCALPSNGLLSMIDRGAQGTVRPQRTISQGGAPATYIGLAVDPVADEIYVAASSGQVQVYSGDGAGGFVPARALQLPGTLWGAIAVDPAAHELFAIDRDSGAVSAYDAHASGAVSARRTFDSSVWSIAFDDAHGELWTSVDSGNFALFNIYPSGSSTPSRSIQGSDYFASNISIDSTHNLLYGVIYNAGVEVYDLGGSGALGPIGGLSTTGDGTDLLGYLGPSAVAADQAGHVWVSTVDGKLGSFASANGVDTSPLSVIRGPATAMTKVVSLAVIGDSVLALDALDGLLVFSRSASGNAAPIGSAAASAEGAIALALDAATGNIVTVSSSVPAVTVFAAASSGVAPSVSTIAGSAAGIVAATSAAVSSGELFVSDGAGDAIYVFPSDASGDPAPTRALAGPHTTLSRPSSVAASSTSLLVANAGDDSIAVFARGASGDTAPSLRIGGPSTQLAGLTRIAYDESAQTLFAASSNSGLIAVFSLAGVTPDPSGLTELAPIRTLLAPNLSGLSLDPAQGELYAFGPDGVAVYAEDADGAAAPLRTLQLGGWSYDAPSGTIASFNGSPLADAIPCGPLPAAARTPYKMLLPGAALGVQSRAYGVSTDGRVVGSYQTANDGWHAAIFNGDGTVSDLGEGAALSIGPNGGVIGGGCPDLDVNLGFEPFIFTYARGPLSSYQGAVGGWNASNIGAYWVNNSSHAWAYAPFAGSSGLTDYGAPRSGDAWAVAINASNVLAGSILNGSSARAFFASPGDLTTLGTFGGTSSQAWGINDSGLVVGQADLPGREAGHHAFSYDTSMHDLGTLGGVSSVAFAVNASGQIVGSADLGLRFDVRGIGMEETHAALWQNGKLLDLGAVPGGDSTAARGISSSGIIVGIATDWINNDQAVEWVPNN